MTQFPSAPRRLAAAAVVAGALAACGIAPAPSSPVPTSPASSPSSPLGWSPVDLAPSAEMGAATGVAIVGDRAVVVGNVVGSDQPGGSVPVAWTTTDFSAWTTEPLPGPAFFVDSVMGWGERLLAVGGGETSACAHPFAITTWVRDAGGTWSQAPFVPLLCAGGSAVAATSGQTAVVVGSGSGDQPYAWSSLDGLHWTDHPGAFGQELPSFVAALPGGDFIAGGRGPNAPWIAESTDGAGWRPRPDLDARAVPLGGITAGGRLRVFVGDDSGAVGELSTADGHDWRVQQVDGLELPVNHFVPLPGGLIALGANRPGDAWISADGARWRRLALPPADQVSSAAIVGDRAVLVGSMAAAGGSHPAVWVGPASLLAP